LTVDGREEPFPGARVHRLTERQRELVRFVATYDSILTLEAKMFYADAHGALKRLEALGLIEHVRRGRWRIVVHGTWGERR